MSRNQKSTLPVHVKQQTTIAANDKRIMSYLATTLIILCAAAVIVGGMKLL